MSFSLSSISTTEDDELTADCERQKRSEAFGKQKMAKETFEKCAKMETELKELKQLSNSKIRELELENKLVQAELREQKLLTERNEKKMGELERQQLEELGRQHSAQLEEIKDQSHGQLMAVQNELLEKIAKMEQEEKKKKNKWKNESDDHQQQMALLERLMDKIGVVDAIIWALKEQMGKACGENVHLVNAIHTKVTAMEHQINGQSVGKLADTANLMAQIQTAQNEISARILTFESVVGILKDQSKKVQSNCWDVVDCHRDLKIILPQCLAVHYKANGWVVRSVFAKWPISPSDSAIFYFEMQVEEMRGWMSIGLATKEMPLDKEAGWHKDSFGYTSYGYVWINGSGRNKRIQNFSVGDVVGCGVNLTNRRLFFTKNGQNLAGIYAFAISTPIDSLFPCVSLGDSGDKIVANFGPHFKFDVGTLSDDGQME